MLSASPPGLHGQPWWPFAWRPEFAVLADDNLRAEVLDGVLGLACAFALLALATRWRRARLLLIPAAGLAWFAMPHLALLLVSAEPTVFWEAPSAGNAVICRAWQGCLC